MIYDMSNILKHTINKLPLTKGQKKNLNSNKLKNNVIKVTWKELKDLRDNGQLVPGCWYRMTDYETIVAPSNEYKSAGHQFDLLILATDVNKLSEDCKACRHEGDTYFPEDTNFEAWEVKYCLDNNKDWTFDEGIYVQTHVYLDLSAFGEEILNEDVIASITSTSDATIPGFPYRANLYVMGQPISFYVDTLKGDNYNLYLQLPEGLLPPGISNILGPFPEPFAINTISDVKHSKGAIYELKDEYNNHCGYDFKNILFTVTKLKNDVLIEHFKNNPHASITEAFNTASEEEKEIIKNYIGFFTLDPITDGFELDKEVDLYTFSSYDGFTESITDMSLNINKLASVKENDLGVRDIGLNSTIIVQNKLVEQYVYGLKIKSSNINQCNVINGTCSGLTTGDYFAYNTIFGNIIDSNIGIGFHNNIIAGDIENVKIGHHFNGNYIKAFIKNVVTGSWIANNVAEDYIQISTLGNNISNCNFKGTGSSGSIHRTTINNLLHYVTFEKSLSGSIIENDIQDVKFTGIVSYCNIHSNLWGNTSTHQAPIIIEGDVRHKDIRKNSAGKVVIYNPADLAPESAIIQ